MPYQDSTREHHNEGNILFVTHEHLDIFALLFIVVGIYQDSTREA
jgi:hypothetical protein